MTFVALDVETANADLASICQIGAAKFIDGQIAGEWSSFINPEDYFDDVNVSIHGIDEDAVQGAPTFPEIVPVLSEFVGQGVVVSHTHFDRVAIHQAASRHRVSAPDWAWLDSARVVRRAWPEFAVRGYGLANVCKVLGIHFQHHDALEDAKAAGQVLVQAMAHSELDLVGWLARAHQPINPSSSSLSTKIKREGNPDGPLFGEILVFTGALEIPRREAADMAAAVGCEVGQSVTKKTTILVVGDQDIMKLAGETKSTKHRRAEELVLKGFSIRILRETDFRELAQMGTL